MKKLTSKYLNKNFKNDQIWKNEETRENTKPIKSFFFNFVKINVSVKINDINQDLNI